MRTADLIEAFPEPPCPRGIDLRHPSHARLSLFPALARLSDRSEDVRGTVHKVHRPEILNAVVNSAEKDRRDSASFIQQLEERPYVPCLNDLQKQGAWCSGGLPNLGGGDGTVETTQSVELNDRHEGLDAASQNDHVLRNHNDPLITVEPDDKGAAGAPLTHSVSPTSGRTEATRYFSAASHMIPATKIANIEASTTCPAIPDAKDRTEEKSQRDRAVANGALRFVSQIYSTVVSSSMADLSTNHDPDSPVVLARHVRPRAEVVSPADGTIRLGSAPLIIKRLQINRERLSVHRPIHLKASVKRLAQRVIRAVEGSSREG